MALGDYWNYWWPINCKAYLRYANHCAMLPPSPYRSVTFPIKGWKGWRNLTNFSLWRDQSVNLKNLNFIRNAFRLIEMTSMTSSNYIWRQQHHLRWRHHDSSYLEIAQANVVVSIDGLEPENRYLGSWINSKCLSIVLCVMYSMFYS